MTRLYLAPETEAMFRRVSHSRVISHVAKRCQCGKQTTAKQLAQYGKCVACQHNVTDSEIRDMRIQVKGMIAINAPSAPSSWTKARKA